jgi:HlyD family secretion protein
VKKLLKIGVWISVSLIVIFLVYIFFFKKNGKENLTLIEVKKGTIVKKAVAVGQIEPRIKFQVKSKISGIVKTCAVDVGDTVKTGDVLFEIAPDPTPQELIEVTKNYEYAKASFERAKADYERAMAVFKEKIISQSDLDEKKESFELANSNLMRAKETLELTMKGRVASSNGKIENTIKAQAPGSILTRSVNPGDPVVPLTSYQAGTELATLADMSDLIFKGTVDEIDVGKLKEGMKAKVIVGAMPGDFLEGKLTKISPQATQKEGSTLFDVEIELNNNKGFLLRAGYSSNAELIIEQKENVLTLPERLVSFENSGKDSFVEVSASSKEVKKIGIKTGLSDGLNVEVISGLKEGDKVVERPPKEIS